MHAVTLIVFVFTASLAGQAQVAPGVPVVREIARGSTHAYEVVLAEGEYFTASLGYDADGPILNLFEAGGDRLKQAAPDDERVRVDSLAWVATRAGVYVLQVQLRRDHTAATSRYRLSIDQKRPSTREELRRFAAAEAETARFAAYELRQRATAASLKKAESKYAHALALDRTFAPDRLIDDLYWLGRTRSDLRQVESARVLFEERARLAVAAGRRKDEGVTLSWLASIARDAGNLAAAERLFTQSLAIATELGDFNEISNRTKSLSEVRRRQGDYTAPHIALETLLARMRQSGDRAAEAELLVDLGDYWDDRDPEKALAFMLQALEIQKGHPRRTSEGNTLNSLASVYQNLNQYEKALAAATELRSIAAANRNRLQEALALSQMGLAYLYLGSHHRSNEQYELALDLYREMNSRRDEAIVIGNIAMNLAALRRHDEALTHYDRALAIHRDLRNDDSESAVSCNKALTLNALGRHDDAMSLCERALAHAIKAGNRQSEGTSVYKLALIAYAKKDYAAARQRFADSIAIFRVINAPARAANSLYGLMLVARDAGNAAEAIFYGKQAVNGFQQIRTGIAGLARELRTGFLKSKEDAYRDLAGLLLSTGRLPEAEQVLALLKDEEHASIVRLRSQTASSVGYSPAEAAAASADVELAALSRERGELLARSDRQELDAAGKERLTAINEAIRKENARFREALAAVSAAPATAQRVAEVKDAPTLTRSLNAIGRGTVALYTVLATENGKAVKGWIMLVTPDFRRAYDMNVVDVEQTVADFRAAMAPPGLFDPRPPAVDLYDRIFRTPQPGGRTLERDLAEYLKGRDQPTLLWSLDGVLRYVPMAALSPDGVSYLVERYRNVVFTTASIAGLASPVSASWTAAGFGVSKEHEVAFGSGPQEKLTFVALESVPQELAAVKKALRGTSRLDASFTEAALIEDLREGHPVVHIASHFHYQAANPEESFLLLGDGQPLPLRKFADFEDIFRRTELLTLSACDTAMSAGGVANGKEVEGLAFSAQKLGAQSVIATLWPVEDVGTQVLMPAFYTARGNGVTKAEALRQAQLHLLKAPTGPAATASVATDAVAPKRRVPFVQDPARPYAHPLYWAPFILIGNPR